MAETGPDVVHLHSGKAGLAGRLVVRDRVPTVFQPHAWSFLAPRSGVQGASLRWERYAARWTTELVCVSATERQLGESLGVHAPTTVIPNGIDLVEYRPAGARDRVARPQAARARRRPHAALRRRPDRAEGSAGPARRLARRCGPGSRTPGCCWSGTGPTDAPSSGSPRAWTGCVFAGARTDVPTWLAAADVVVVPSRWEGMALVPLEAMACARSVVATDVNGVVDSVPPGAGAIVELDDSAGAGRRRWCAGSGDPALAEDEGWTGRSHVETHHDVTTSARELARVYLRLVGVAARSLTPTGLPPATPPAYRSRRTRPSSSAGSASSRVRRSSRPTGPIRPEMATENVVPGRATDRARRVRNLGTVTDRPRSSTRGWRDQHPAGLDAGPAPRAPRRRGSSAASVTRATSTSTTRLTARTGSPGAAAVQVHDRACRRPARAGAGRAPRTAGKHAGTA